MKYEQRNDKRQVDKINKKETRRRKKIKRFTIIKRSAYEPYYQTEA